MTPPQTLTTVTTAGRPSVPRMDTVLASRWARVLVPSLSDLFFLAVLVVAVHELGRRRLGGSAGGRRRRLAHPDRRVHPGSPRGSTRGPVLVFEARRALVRLGVAHRRDRRRTAPGGGTEGNCAAGGCSDRAVRADAGPQDGQPRRAPVRGAAGRAAGRGRIQHPLPGAPAPADAAAAFDFGVDDRRGPQAAQLQDLVAGAAHRGLDQPAWRIPGADRGAGPGDRGSAIEALFGSGFGSTGLFATPCATPSSRWRARPRRW